MLDLISVDDHVIESPSVWHDRLPRRFRGAGPSVIEHDGADYWRYEDRLHATKRLNVAAGFNFDEYSREPTRYADMRVGCYDARARVADMDRDGVRASLCFPSFPRFCGQTFLEAADKELADLCVKAWNDFILDEWCPAAPGRLIPLVIGQLWDPLLFAAEVERTASKGAKAVAFCENPAMLGLASFHSSHWDPVWQSVVDNDVVVCLHVGSSSVMPHPSDDAPRAVGMALIPVNAQSACTDLIMSRVPRKFPSIRIVLSESGIGWVPFVLERADRMWERHRSWAELDGELPSEVFDRNVWVSFIDDAVGVELRDRIGVHKILWECDYPHSDSCWPRSQERVTDLLGGIAAEHMARITHVNAEMLFGLD
jgi:predicted TIM-barrel fold metal-dependent hydrolase